MELMIVLAPHNQPIIDLLAQGGEVVACRITTEGEIPAELGAQLADIITEAAKKVDALAGGAGADITATEAAARADGATVLGAPKTPVEVLFKTVWSLILAGIRARSAEQRRDITITPFANIAGKLHKPRGTGPTGEWC
jgi:hypothetical protein